MKGRFLGVFGCSINRLKNGLPGIIFFLMFFFLSISLQAQLRIDRHLLTGRQQLSQSKFSDALQTFSRIIRTQDDNWEAFYYRGLTKFYLGDEGGSETDFNRAISLQANLAELYLYRGIVRDYSGEHYKALEDFNMGISLKEEDPVLHYSRGTTYLRLNNFSRAIEDFDIAIDKDPRMHNAFLNRGIARAKLLDRDGAFADFNEAIMLNPFKGDGHQRKGLLLYETGEYQEALVSFSEAIQRDSANTQSWYARALTWDEAGRKDSCLSDLSRVIELNPRHAAAIYNRAIVRSQVEDYEGGISDYLRVNELYPNHVLSFFNRGILRQQTGDMDGALADLSVAINLYPDFSKAYLARSSMYRAMGRMEEAHEDQILAQEKIQANQGKSREELALSYADTTVQFEELISLNSQFMKSFSSLAETIEDKQFDPMGFFRLNNMGELILDGVQKPSKYQQLRMSMSYPDFDPDILMGFPELIQALELVENKQFNEAIVLMTDKISEGEMRGPALMMRAVFRHEMIEFVLQTGVLNEVVPLQLGASPKRGARDFSNQVDYSEVEDDYTLLIDSYPDISATWYNRGLTRLYSRNYAGAEDDMTRALELDPALAVAWYNRGILRLYAVEMDQNIKGDKNTGCLDLSRAGELGIEKAYLVIAQMCVKQ